MSDPNGDKPPVGAVWNGETWVMPPAPPTTPTVANPMNPYDGKLWDGRQWVNPDGTPSKVNKDGVPKAAKVLLGALVIIVVAFLGLSYWGSQLAKDFDAASPAVDTSQAQQPSTDATQRDATTNGTDGSDLPVIEAGTWLVPGEIKPGYYRVAGYYARLDASDEIIDNDGVYDPDQLTLAVVRPSDAALKIRGEAVALEDLPAIDPVGNGAMGGTYVVGADIPPGKYRVSADDSGTAYIARLDENLETIDNELGDGNVILTIRSSDFAVKYRGNIERLT